MIDNLTLAFGLLAVISGFSLLCLSVDTAAYSRPPTNRWKFILGLLVATLAFTFLAILFNGKGCQDYTKSDYEYGRVPVSCEAPKEQNQ